ncbi:peroxidase-like [Galleria mellonella]|uniref:Peroxidase-like n=1 Tax=Galleria mellonella TaxID=7137 RepID=A0ABM3MBM6_GALME|nr:peroxidase-like [Galleria mellonella]
MYLVFFILASLLLRVEAGLFDRYSGKKIEDNKKAKEFQSTSLTEVCSINIKSCTPHEGSRIDGTCNNYKYPSTGSARGPYLRLFKPDYTANNTIRKDINGKPLPSARKIRTTLLSKGRVNDPILNVAAVHFLEFINRDVSTLNISFNYLKHVSDCCNTQATDPRCAPIEVPDDDPYLKVTNIRCLNFSRAETFKDIGCTPQIKHPEQINYQTPTIDLSTIYGVDEKALSTIREFKNGSLREEKIANPNNKTEDLCVKYHENETICYKFGYPEIAKFDLRTTTFSLFFIREHNRLAKALHKINPCWKDDRLFKVARMINIATAANMFMYELLPELMGYRNMINHGLISKHIEYVTAYDEDAVPLVYAEYELAMRFFHTFWDGRIKKYDENLHFVGDLTLSDTLFSYDSIQNDKIFKEVNRGTFFQNAGKIDDIIDPEISENFYSKIEKAHDLMAEDIQRGRDMSVPPYNKYRQLCGMTPAKKFEDFLDAMNIEKMETLKTLYNNVDDVDLFVGIVSENFVQEAHIGPTLYCIMAKQLQIFRFADRFWFERGDQFHSFSLSQLHEIRKSNMARFACDNAGIEFIQPRAFYVPGHGHQYINAKNVELKGDTGSTVCTRRSTYKPSGNNTADEEEDYGDQPIISEEFRTPSFLSVTMPLHAFNKNLQLVQQVGKISTDFENAHLLILDLHDDSESDDEGVRESFDDMYFNVLALQRTYTKPKVRNEPEQNSSSHIKLPKDTIKSVNTASLLTHNSSVNTTVLLATAIVTVKDRLGNIQTFRALFDTGSQNNFITEEAVNRLNLNLVSSSYSIKGLGDVSAATSGIVRCVVGSLSANNTEVSFELDMHVIPKICCDQPIAKLNTFGWSHIESLNLADPGFAIPGPVDLLLGADVFADSLLTERIKGGPSQPPAFNSVFGWLLLGKTLLSCSSLAALQSNVESERLVKLVEQFWELDSVSQANSYTPEDILCEKEYVATTTRDKSGRYEVYLPFKNSCEPVFMGSREIAERRFYALERRLSRNPDLKCQYVNFMQDYIQSGHMSLVPVSENRRGKYYIPHHCIIRPTVLQHSFA